MKEKLSEIKLTALECINDCNDLAALEDARIRFLGKKGELTAVLRGMGALSAEERPVVGALANEVRSAIEAAIDEKKTGLAKAIAEAKLKEETIDVTMPGKTQPLGKQHPLTKVLEEMTADTESVAKILLAVKPKYRAAILAEMNPTNAAKITKKMLDLDEEYFKNFEEYHLLCQNMIQ